MTQLTLQHIVRLHELLEDGKTFETSFSQTVGGTSTGNGLWRFFSDSWPHGGIVGWNTRSAWKSNWQPFLPSGIFSFGEDVFGNQMISVNGFENALLWNHENGDCFDLLLSPCELLKTVVEKGIDWIDLYSNGALAVARQHGAVPLDMHLHWTMPLILGGQVSQENLSRVLREPHFIGHAKLWSQVSGLPPGTAVVAT